MAKKLNIKKVDIVGTLTTGSPTVTGIGPSLITQLVVGDTIYGDGIPSGTRIKTIDVIGGSITLGNAANADVNATASGSKSLTVMTDDVLVKRADLLDGYHASESNSTSTVVVRDSNKNINVDSVTLTGSVAGAGKFSYSNDERLPQFALSSSVTLAIGGDIVIPVYNSTASNLTDGQAVYPVGSSSGYFSVALAQSDDHETSHTTLGLVSETIAPGAVGFVTMQGRINSTILDPAIFTVNDVLYLSPTTPGAYTNVKPVSPDQVFEIGWVKKVSTNSSTDDGEIYVKTHSIPLSEDISYDPTDVSTEYRLNATNVKGAIDELALTKANISDLSSNIALYPTTAASAISGYNKLVSSPSEAGYDTTAANVSTGSITTDDQLVGQLVSEQGIFVGNPGVINIATIGNIRRTSGNSNQYVAFYFEIYKRDASGTETLLTTSNETPDIRPLTNNVYEQFSASALLNNGTFLSTDRIVVRFKANLTGNTGSVYEFQFGGENPVRILFPVPITVIPSDTASDILTNTANFNGILSGTNTTVQSALDTLDDHNHDGRYFTETESNTNFVRTDTTDQNIAGTKTFTGDKIVLGNSQGDEGGEILLAKPQTNTTIAGTGVTVDIWQNRLRFFEQGGNARGFFLDITAGANGVATNLAAGGGTVTSVSAGDGMNFTTIVGVGNVTLGTPSSLTDSTSNSVSGTTHTHAITNYSLSGTANVISVSGTPKVLGSASTLNLLAGHGDTVNPYGSKTANNFLAAPNGSNGSPTFRAIAAADIPTLNQSTTGNAGSATLIATTQKSDDVNYQVPFVTSVTAGNQALHTDSTASITFNPSTNVLNVPNLTVTGNITVNNVEMISTSNGIVFEGTTNDGNETTLIAVNPTADQTYQLPNKSAGTYTIATTTDMPTENNATLTIAAGTGVSLSATPTFTANASVDKTITVTNSAPDQTVVLTGAGLVTTSGTYPNFTITGTHPTFSRSDTASAVSPAFGGTFTAVDSVTADNGHVTAINLKTVTLPTPVYPTVNNGTLTLAVSGTGLSGSATFTANQSGSSTFTVTSNATDAATSSTIVARDSSGDIKANSKFYYGANAYTQYNSTDNSIDFVFAS